MRDRQASLPFSLEGRRSRRGWTGERVGVLGSRGNFHGTALAFSL